MLHRATPRPEISHATGFGPIRGLVYSWMWLVLVKESAVMWYPLILKPLWNLFDRQIQTSHRKQTSKFCINTVIRQQAGHVSTNIISGPRNTDYCEWDHAHPGLPLILFTPDISLKWPGPMRDFSVWRLLHKTVQHKNEIPKGSGLESIKSREARGETQLGCVPVPPVR